MFQVRKVQWFYNGRIKSILQMSKYRMITKNKEWNIIHSQKLNQTFKYHCQIIFIEMLKWTLKPIPWVGKHWMLTVPVEWSHWTPTKRHEKANMNVKYNHSIKTFEWYEAINHIMMNKILHWMSDITSIIYK